MIKSEDYHPQTEVTNTEGENTGRRSCAQHNISTVLSWSF